MICPEYDNLIPIEKAEYIGSLTHSCMNDSELFRIGLKLIETAKVKGVFSGVTVMPKPIEGQVIPDA